MFDVATAGDERHHPPGSDPLWNESWYFDFAAPDGRLGGYVRVGLYPNLGVCWYWASLVGPDRRTVMVVDNAVPLPRPGTLEVRSDGLWADHNCEEPLDRWSLGLEAFGVALDDPGDAYSGMVGHRTPLGFDLEWETDGSVFSYPEGLDRYEVPCRVHGEILVADETIEFDGVGQRDHSWGVRDWWSMSWFWSAIRLDGDGASRVHAVTTLPDQGLAIGYVQSERGNEVVHAVSTGIDAGFPFATSRVEEGLVMVSEQGATQLSLEPLAWAPVLLTHPDGRESRFPRALCRATDTTGSVGVGWIELNLPQGPA